jgi:hypothetical protein
MVYKHGKPWRKASSESKARAMVRALYANEKGAKSKPIKRKPNKKRKKK